MRMRVGFRGLSSLYLVLAVLTIFGMPVAAKCPRNIITIRGEVHGEVPKGAAVEVRISPDPKYKNAPVPIVDGKFEVEALFDTFKSMGWLGREKCSRKPESVVVVLTAEGEELDLVTLKMPGDFKEPKESYFETRTPVSLSVEGRNRDPRNTAHHGSIGYEPVAFLSNECHASKLCQRLRLDCLDHRGVGSHSVT